MNSPRKRKAISENILSMEELSFRSSILLMLISCLSALVQSSTHSYTNEGRKPNFYGFLSHCSSSRLSTTFNFARIMSLLSHPTNRIEEAIKGSTTRSGVVGLLKILTPYAAGSRGAHKVFRRDPQKGTR